MYKQISSGYQSSLIEGVGGRKVETFGGGFSDAPKLSAFKEDLKSS